MGVAAAPFVLAYIGRPVRRKGFHLLLKAWERSGLGNQNNVLLIAGCTAAECESALGRTIAGVRGLGYLTDLHELYAACDAVTLPSEHEGFPYLAFRKEPQPQSPSLALTFLAFGVQLRPGKRACCCLPKMKWR
ncbi:MAG: glycosyltransferase family 4 protein [Leptolyngbyaceae cyanobacterium SU_3_3]|nr:glycosyltransferase family 4 protein [Leptolyngbyaceae cyanobacterium SU_3_3]